MKNWFAVDIVVEPNAAAAVESALNVLDSLGIEIELFNKSTSEPQIVTGFFDVLPGESEIRLRVNESLSIHGFPADAVKSIETRTIEETDWLAEWKKHWKPTVVGKFVIAPPWESVVENEKIVIRIEPNMAFGTGTHETTQLCLQAISDRCCGGHSFLDIGTGTGILAIAAAKLAAESAEKAEIFACDTDADSVKIAKENAVLNEVGEQIEFVHGEITDNTPAADFVCANLTIDVIVPLMPLLLAKTRETLVLSGILLEQKHIIESELETFQVSSPEFKVAGEWIAVIISME